MKFFARGYRGRAASNLTRRAKLFSCAPFCAYSTRAAPCPPLSSYSSSSWGLCNFSKSSSRAAIVATLRAALSRPTDNVICRAVFFSRIFFRRAREAKREWEKASHVREIYRWLASHREKFLGNSGYAFFFCSFLFATCSSCSFWDLERIFHVAAGVYLTFYVALFICCRYNDAMRIDKLIINWYTLTFSTLSFTGRMKRLELFGIIEGTLFIRE